MLESFEELRTCDSTDVPGSGLVPLTRSHKPRVLTPQEQAKLDNDQKILSEFKQQKLEKEALKNWDLFYKRNTTKFFKDRHWTTREFEELCGKKVVGGQKLVVLEVGCGVGNFIFPLLEQDEDLFFYACDFSPRAVQFVKDNPLYTPERCCAFQCDLTTDPLSTNIQEQSVDIVSMIFVLSAIHPDKMSAALENIYKVLKPGGCVLLRDYGLYDHAMLRFTPGHKLADNFYVRQDGTRAYYFTEEVLAKLFIQAGFIPVINEYVLRETVNKKEGLCVPRVFVQSKFMRGHSDNTEEKEEEALLDPREDGGHEQISKNAGCNDVCQVQIGEDSGVCCSNGQDGNAEMNTAEELIRQSSRQEAQRLLNTEADNHIYPPPHS